MEIRTNTITATIGKDPFTTTLIADGHTILVDEPEDKGGNNKGPRPGDLLLASLVSCTVITVKMYANRKQWNLDEVYANAIMERKTESGIQITSIVEELSFKGNLDTEQINRLMDIASKCPIHKTLKAAIHIEFRLKS